MNPPQATLSAGPTQWDEVVAARQGHLLQSWAWGELKRRFGWTALRLQVGQAAAQVLFRRLPLGLSVAYIPRGPLVDWTDSAQGRALFAAIHAEARKRRAVFLKVEPDLWAAPPGQNAEDAAGPPAGPAPGPAQAARDFLEDSGFRPADTIQPAASLIIDIGGDEAGILAAMKQKTRYNVRLAQKKGVTVRQGGPDQVAVFHQLALATSTRSDFGVHSLDYYRAAYDLFSPDRCALLLAEFEGEPLAALMAFRQGREAYYFYGASANRHRNLMPTYLLQWAAIRWAKSHNCTHYDLWGIPEADPAALEAEFMHRHDGLWGVYRFKRGFGGEQVRTVGAYDYVYKPLLYRLYRLRRRF